MAPAVPISMVATENTPVPWGPGMFMMPSFVTVAAIDSMSGGCVACAVMRIVLRPDTDGAGAELAHWKIKGISSENKADGVIAK